MQFVGQIKIYQIFVENRNLSTVRSGSVGNCFFKYFGKVLSKAFFVEGNYRLSVQKVNITNLNFANKVEISHLMQSI